MRFRSATGVAAAAILAATGITYIWATAAAPSVGRTWAFVSAANSSHGMDEGAAWTDGTTLTPFTVTGPGYTELTGPDGLCLTYTTSGIVSKACTGTATQEWRAAHTPQVWWNEYYDTAHHTARKFGSGYSHSVVTAASPGGNLTLACPDSVNGSAWPYGADQQWSESASVTTAPAPSPAPSSPRSPSPPPCTTPAGIVPAPDGVPCGHVGALISSMTGTDIATTWDQTQTGFDGPHTYGTVGTDAAGDAVLATNGAKDNEAMVASYATNGSPTMDDYTHGIFEARLNLPDNGSGKIANWPAFWLSGDGLTWPVGGEFDIMEGLSGNQRSHYFWNIGRGTVSGVAGPTVALAPGWHTFDGVWGPGYVAVYIDGSLQWSYTSANVESDAPLQVIFDMAGTGSNTPSTLLVAYLRAWAWR